jgi:transposase-like protein
MRKVAPSMMVREQIEQILRDGVDTETNLLSTLAHLGLKQIVQQALEQEQEDFLGRGRYERQEHSTHKGRSYRNGYEDSTLATAEGEVSVRMPQVRGGVLPTARN